MAMQSKQGYAKRGKMNFRVKPAGAVREREVPPRVILHLKIRAGLPVEKTLFWGEK